MSKKRLISCDTTDYKCPECGKMFSTPRGMMAHYQIKHGRSTPAKKAIVLEENHGYGQMIIGQGRFLYWIPGASRAGDEKWRADTEERLRDRIALRFIEKRL